MSARSTGRVVKVGLSYTQSETTYRNTKMLERVYYAGEVLVAYVHLWAKKDIRVVIPGHYRDITKATLQEVEDYLVEQLSSETTLQHLKEYAERKVKR